MDLTGYLTEGITIRAVDDPANSFFSEAQEWRNVLGRG